MTAHLFCSSAVSAWFPVGFLAGLAAAGIVRLVRKRDPSAGEPYDERQLAARGTAYRRGFFAVLVYGAAYALLDSLGVRFADGVAGPFIGIYIGAAVFGCTAAAKDAYAGFRDRSATPRGAAVLTALSAAWAVLAGIRFFRGEGIENGMLAVGSLLFFTPLLFLSISMTMLIRFLSQRREKGEEE